MRVIDAFWERESLGLSAAEILIEGSDTPDGVLNQLSDVDAEYQVAKLPAGRMDLSETLRQAGFSFSEGLLALSIPVDDPASTAAGEASDYSLMTEVEEVQLEQVILAGLFATDRISNDSNFTPMQAARRYLRWIKDEKGRGADLLALQHAGQTVGFVLIRKVDEKTCHSYLVGIYPEFGGRGLSDLIVSSGRQYARSKGCSLLTTSVSANNLGSLRAHFKAGYLPTSVQYVFVKHAG